MLTVQMVKAAKRPGDYPDKGGARGLILRVAPGGSKQWLFRFQLHGKQTRHGLGSADDVGLAEARERAIDARRLVKQGINPVAQRRDAVAEAIAAAATQKSFAECAALYIDAKAHEWRDPTNRQKWENSLRDYAMPVFGSLPVDRVETGHVTAALQPIWTTKTETASRVRQRIEAILDYAKVNGWRSGENPAAWNGHLENVFARPTKVRKRVHYAALDYRDLGDFFAKLRTRGGISARALELCILTASRTGNILGARWEQFDMAARTWSIEDDEMKAGRAHTVPLSDAAMAIVESMAAIRSSDYVFPGTKPGCKMAHTALRDVRDAMGFKGEFTPHGFRATFSTWVAEQTAFDFETREAALAHVVGNATTGAYQRGELLEKRRKLMNAWARYCAKPTAPAAETDATVVPIRAG